MVFKAEFLLPFFLGLCAVLQGGINRRISNDWGLSWTIFFNTIVLLVVASCCVFFGIWGGRPSLSTFKWWYLLPGLMGFAIVAGIPLAISKVGASSTFMLIIAAQIIFSALWDNQFEGIAFSYSKLTGGLIVLAGAWIATR